MKEKPTGLEIIEKINNLGARVRILEDHHSTLRKRSQTIEENLLNVERDVNKQLKLLGDELLELKQEVEELKEQLEDIAINFREAAKSHEVIELLTYLKLLEPFKFATLKDLEKLKEK
ncbi:hypothetical protein J7L02_00330 [Candidatus Woesearchaeota archaeon]|nr:hypothetical protein [Candidatus Woesearchaeota archaeon]